jgi:uncharacterized membrane protein
MCYSVIFEIIKRIIFNLIAHKIRQILNSMRKRALKFKKISNNIILIFELILIQLNLLSILFGKVVKTTISTTATAKTNAKATNLFVLEIETRK